MSKKMININGVLLTQKAERQVLSTVLKKATKRNNSTEVHSFFFDRLNQKTQVFAWCKQICPTEFSHFCHAFTSTYRVLMTSTSLVNVAASLVLLYSAFFIMHSNQFISYIHSRNKKLFCPSFIFPVLDRIIRPVRSKTKVTGWVYGELIHCNQEVGNWAVEEIVTLKSQVPLYLESLQGTMLSKVAADAKLSDQFKARIEMLLSNIDSTSSNEDVFELILDSLEVLPEIIYNNDDKFEMTYINIEDLFQPHLGIYRYRNLRDQVYLTQAMSISNVNPNTQDLMACFLKIFSPDFNTSTGDGSAQPIIPGDVLISVENTSLSECWELYLSFDKLVVHSKEKRTKKTDKMAAPMVSEADRAAILAGLMDGYGDYVTSVDGGEIYFYRSTKTINYSVITVPFSQTVYLGAEGPKQACS